MKTDDFDYFLPEELIAQTPLLDRSSSRLLVLDRKTATFTDKKFTDILDYLQHENLRDAGWRVLRVSWPDYDDWEQLRIRLSRTLGPINPTPECRLLWKLPTQRCDGPLRRFYSWTRRIGHHHAGR